MTARGWLLMRGSSPVPIHGSAQTALQLATDGTFRVRQQVMFYKLHRYTEMENSIETSEIATNTHHLSFNLAMCSTIERTGSSTRLDA